MVICAVACDFGASPTIIGTGAESETKIQNRFLALDIPTASDTAAPTVTHTPTATDSPTSTPTETATSTVTPTPYVINPLTGIPVSDPSLVLRRPIGIKVSNYPRTARPQAGLTSADALFEFYQEGGETHWHAIFLSRDSDKVGPIRSARKVDARLEQIFQSILIFNAADYRVYDWFGYEDVRKYAIPEGPGSCPAICRDTSQVHINQVYGNTSAIRKLATQLGIPEIIPDLSGWMFQEETPVMGGDVATVRVRYLTNKAIAEWRYNPEDHMYYRWSEKDDTSGKNLVPLLDRNTGKQVSVSNLAILFVKYYRTDNRVEMYDVQFYGDGRAIFFRDGKMEEGTWRMPNYNRLPHFYGEHSDGSYLLKPGISWITLVELNSVFSIEDDLARLEFGQPRG